MDHRQAAVHSLTLLRQSYRAHRPPGWLQAQGLIPHPQQPRLREMLWLLLPEGRG